MQDRMFRKIRLSARFFSARPADPCSVVPCAACISTPSESPVFFTVKPGRYFSDGFLMEFMNFFDKKDNRHLAKREVDFFLTFVKQQIIKGLTLEIIRRLSKSIEKSEGEIFRTKENESGRKMLIRSGVMPTGCCGALNIFFVVDLNVAADERCHKENPMRR